MKINVHIERLVLDGYAGIGGEAVRAALTRELAQRLGAAPPPLAGAAVPSLQAQAPMAPATSAASLGRGVAQALHGALVGSTRP